MRAVRFEGSEAGRGRGPGGPPFLTPLVGAALLAALIAALLLADRADEPDADAIAREDGRPAVSRDEAGRLRGRRPGEPLPLPAPPAPRPAQADRAAEEPGALLLELEVHGEDPPPCRVTVTGPRGFTETVALTPDAPRRLEGLERGVYEAVVHDVDGWTGTGGVCVPAPASATTPRRSITWEPAASLAGRVVDGLSGAPVPGALVRAIVEDDYPFYGGRTAAGWQVRADAGGRFRLPAVPAARSLVLIATSPGYQASDVDVSAGGRGTIRVPLLAAGRVAGVVRAPDGRPAVGALVFAVPPRHGEIRAPTGDPWPAARFRPAPGETAVLFDCDFQQGEVSSVRPPWVVGTQTDEDGSYVLDGVTMERLLHVQAHPSGTRPGMRPSVEAPLVLAADRPTERVDLTLNEAARLAVDVVSPDGTRPPQVSVEFPESSFARSQRVPRGDLTWDLPAGTHRVRVQHPSGTPWEGEVSLRPGEERTLGVHLRAPTIVRLRVLGPDGEPLRHEGLQVWARQGPHHAGAQKEDDGRYVLTGLSPGPVVALASIRGVEGSQVEVEAVAPAEELVLRIPVLEAPRPDSIRIRVRLPESLELPTRLTVGLWPSQCGTAAALQLLGCEEPWGGGVANTSESEVDARVVTLTYRDHFRGTRALAVLGPGLAPTAIRPADVVDGRAEATPSAARGLEGVLVDAAGRPVAGARVAVDPERSGMLLHGDTDGAGRFRVADAPVDARSLAVVASGFADQVVAVPEGPGPHRFVLDRGGVLAVAVRDAAGRPVVSRTVLLFADGGDASAPRHRLELWAKSRDVIAVRAGTWRIRDEESGNETRVRVATGDTLDVVLVVP